MDWQGIQEPIHFTTLRDIENNKQDNAATVGDLKNLALSAIGFKGNDNGNVITKKLGDTLNFTSTTQTVGGQSYSGDNLVVTSLSDTDGNSSINIALKEVNSSTDLADTTKDGLVTAAAVRNYVAANSGSINWFNVNSAAPTEEGKPVGTDLRTSNFDKDHSGATGTNSTAVGPFALASGEESVALGKNVRSSATGMVAIGRDITATVAPLTEGSTPQYAIAIGHQAGTKSDNTVNTIGSNSIVIGANAYAGKVEGSVVKAAAGATVVGTNSGASGNFATALGANAEAQGNMSLAVGRGTVAAGVSSIAIGSGTGDNATTAAARNTIAIGASAKAITEGATALGASAQAVGGNSTAVGFGSIARGLDSGAFGKSNDVTAQRGYAFGISNAITDSDSLAFGKENSIAGFQSVAIGKKNTIAATADRSGVWGTAEAGTGEDGDDASRTFNTMAGHDSYAIGNSNTVTANANWTFVLGNNVTADKATSVYLGDRAGFVGNGSKGIDNAYTSADPIAGLNFKNFAGGTSVVGIATIGSDTQTRRLQGVAPGLLAVNSTDAINGSQLFDTNTKLGNLATDVKTKFGGNAALDADTGKITFTDIGGTGKGTIHEAIAASREVVEAAANGGLTVTPSDQDSGAKKYTVKIEDSLKTKIDNLPTNTTEELAKKATKDLDNLTDTGKAAITGLVDIVKKDGSSAALTIESSVDDATKKKTFTVGITDEAIKTAAGTTNLVNDLAGKADTNLGNITNEGKDAVTGLVSGSVKDGSSDYLSVENTGGTGGVAKDIKVGLSNGAIAKLDAIDADAGVAKGNQVVKLTAKDNSVTNDQTLGQENAINFTVTGDNSIDTSASGSSITVKVAQGGITTDHIKDGTIQTADLADGAVTEGKLADPVKTKLNNADQTANTLKERTIALGGDKNSTTDAKKLGDGNIKFNITGGDDITTAASGDSVVLTLNKATDFADTTLARAITANAVKTVLESLATNILGTTFSNGAFTAPVLEAVKSGLVGNTNNATAPTTIIQAIQHLTTAANKGLTFAAQSGDAITRQLGETLTLKGQDNYLKTSSDGDGAITVSLTDAAKAKLDNVGGKTADAAKKIYIVSDDGTQTTEQTLGQDGDIDFGVLKGDNSISTSTDGKNIKIKVADGGITTEKLATGAVTTEKLADSAVTTAKLADNAVTGDKIADGTIGAADLANNSVTTDKINDGAVTEGKLATDLQTKITNASTTATKLDNRTISLTGDNSSSTTAQKLGDADISFAITGNDDIVTAASGSSVVLSLNKATDFATATAGRAVTAGTVKSALDSLGSLVGTTINDNGTAASQTFTAVKSGTEAGNNTVAPTSLVGAVGQLTTAVNKGLVFTGDDGTERPLALGEKIAITGADNYLETTSSEQGVDIAFSDAVKTKIDALSSDGKLALKQNNTGDTRVSLNDGINFIDGTNTTASVTTSGVTFNVKPALTGITSISGNGTTVTFGTDGLSLNTKKITGLANGIADADAVNVSQLKSLSSIVGADFNTTGGFDNVTFTAVNSGVAGSTSNTTAPTTVLGAVTQLTTASNKGLNFSADSGDPVNRQLGDTLAIKGNTTKYVETVTGDGAVTVQLTDLAKQKLDNVGGKTAEASKKILVTANTGVTKDQTLGQEEDISFAVKGDDATIETSIAENTTEIIAKVKDGGISTAKLADGAVTTQKLAPSAVTTEKLADSAVTTAKLADNAVTGDKIADGTIQNKDIANSTITEGKLATDLQTKIDTAFNLGTNTIKLTADNSTETDTQNLNNDGGLSFEIAGKDGVTTSAAGKKVSVGLDTVTKSKIDNLPDNTTAELGKKANTSLNNIDTAGKAVITGLVDVVKKEGSSAALTIESSVDDTTKKKTFTVGITDEAIKTAAGTTNLATEYAKSDASNLTDANVTSWRDKLGAITFNGDTDSGVSKKLGESLDIISGKFNGSKTEIAGKEVFSSATYSQGDESYSDDNIAVIVKDAKIVVGLKDRPIFDTIKVGGNEGITLSDVTPDRDPTEEEAPITPALQLGKSGTPVQIKNVAAPTNANDAVNKKYVDDNIDKAARTAKTVVTGSGAVVVTQTTNSPNTYNVHVDQVISYVDEEGNTLTKGPDNQYYQPSDLENKVYIKGEDGQPGQWYNVSDINENGQPKEGTSPIDPPTPQEVAETQLVSPNETSGVATPAQLANVGSALGLDGTSGNDGKNGDNTLSAEEKAGKLAEPDAIGVDAARKVIAGSNTDGKGGLLTTSGKDLNKATTLGDLQAVAKAGLTFVGNNTDVSVHRPLGTTLTIIGEAKTQSDTETETTFASAPGNINVQGDAENNRLIIQLAKKLSQLEEASFSKGDTDPKTVVSNEGITITPSTSSTIDPEDNPVPAKKPVSLTQDGLDNGGNRITNVATPEEGTDAANKTYVDDKVAAARTKVTGTGAAIVSKSSTDPDTYNVHVDETTAFVDNDGNKLIKMPDGNYYRPADLEGKTYNAVDGSWKDSNNQPTDAPTSHTVAGTKLVNPTRSDNDPDGTTTPMTLENVKGLFDDNSVPTIANSSPIPGGSKDSQVTNVSEVNDALNNAYKATPDRAVNVADLKAVNDIANHGFIIKTEANGGTVSNDGFNKGENINPTNDTLTLVAGANIHLQQEEGKITIATNNQAIVNSAQLPITYTNANGERVILGGDGKYYLPEAIEGKTFVADGEGGGKWYDNNQLTNGIPIEGAQPRTLTPQEVAGTRLVDAKGSTTNAIPLGNVGSGIGGEVSDSSGNNTFLTQLDKVAADSISPNIAVTTQDLKNLADTGHKIQTNDNEAVTVKAGDTIQVENGINTKVSEVVSKDGVHSYHLDITGLPIVYKDREGNPLVKVGDIFYKSSDIDKTTGKPKQGASVAVPTGITLVDGEGQLSPQILSGLASAIAPTTVPNKENPTFTEKLAVAAKDEKTQGAAVTVKDLGDLADTGISFIGDNSTVEVKRPLGSKLNIVGEGGYDGSNSAKDNIAVIGDSNQGNLTVKLNKKLTNLESASFSDDDGNKTKVSGDGITITPAGGEPTANISLTTEGLNNGGQRIQNIAPGVKDTDAASVGQLRMLNQGVQQINRRLNTLSKEIDSVAATSAAMASIPQAYLPGKSMVAIAGGSHKSQRAIAIGVSRISDNGKAIIKVNASYNTMGNTTIGVGAGYQW